MSLDGMDEARLRDEEAARDQGHAPDCPHFATVYPWRCACRRPLVIGFDLAGPGSDICVEAQRHPDGRIEITNVYKL